MGARLVKGWKAPDRKDAFFTAARVTDEVYALRRKMAGSASHFAAHPL